MKWIIFGNGWLAGHIREYTNGKISSLRLEDSPVLLKKEIMLFDVVVNCAAKTNIDWCENNKYQTFKDNVVGAVELAKVCKELEKKYVFISSACVFESSNFTDFKFEDSEPNPQCFYSETKAWAEKVIINLYPKTLIIRPRLPVSSIPHPRNTLNKLLGYKFINDMPESVTVVEDMIPVIEDLVNTNYSGIFHLVNSGTISPAEMAKAIKHSFVICSKKDQDERLKKEGRAKRVTTYVDSKRIELLPDIKKRFPKVASNFIKNNAGRI